MTVTSASTGVALPAVAAVVAAVGTGIGVIVADARWMSLRTRSPASGVFEVARIWVVSKSNDAALPTLLMM